MSENTIAVVDNTNEEEVKNFSKGYLTFPFEGEDFKKFISGLLGKPQSISKRISGNFEIELSDLQSLFNLINQRVIQQNNGHLIQFTSKILFNDKSAVQLGSYEELVTYNEVKPIIPSAVKLTWNYLIQFSDKQHPEKQVIELIILTNYGSSIIEENEIPSFLIPDKGEFRINIEHTARSWGADIESTLTNQINSLIKEENKYKKLVRKNKVKISLLASAVFFLTCIFGVTQITAKFMNSELLKVNEFINQKNINLESKLDYLISYVISGVSAKYFFKVGVYLVISLILTIFIGFWVEITSGKNKEESFLIFTRKAKEYRNEIIEKQKKKWNMFILSAFVSVISGIISNFIFNYLINN